MEGAHYSAGGRENAYQSEHTEQGLHEWPAGSTQSAALKTAALVAFWGFFVVDYAGSKSAGGSLCSAGKLSFLLALLAAVLLAAIAGRLLANRSTNGRAQLAGDVDWSDPCRTVLMQVMAGGVGVVAGLLGLGGGELMAPLLLALGMIPQVASATSAFMILFTSSSDFVQYLMEGVLTPEIVRPCTNSFLFLLRMQSLHYSWTTAWLTS